MKTLVQKYESLSEQTKAAQVELDALKRRYDALEVCMDINWAIMMYEKRISAAWEVIFTCIEEMHPKAKHDIEICTKVIERLKERYNNKLNEIKNETASTI